MNVICQLSHRVEGLVIKLTMSYSSPDLAAQLALPQGQHDGGAACAIKELLLADVPDQCSGELTGFPHQNSPQCSLHSGCLFGTKNSHYFSLELFVRVLVGEVSGLETEEWLDFRNNLGR